LGIEHLLSRFPITLSGGEKQRVAIGRALLTAPDIMLMDEPLASLDLPRKRELLPYLEKLSQDVQIPILYVSHS
ncbi:ATP-binding cassette domain-containing protein, partial [Escherichia coli]